VLALEQHLVEVGLANQSPVFPLPATRTSPVRFLPRTFTCDDSLDSFQVFYVNKYIDHHDEIAW
jgi:hypothetical protein